MSSVTEIKVRMLALKSDFFNGLYVLFENKVTLCDVFTRNHTLVFHESVQASYHVGIEEQYSVVIILVVCI